MSTIWKKKLAAWLHDPAEKALVLMRDEVGHEHGSVARLRERLSIARADFDKRADWFAAAADRPQWPFDPDKPRPPWANVHWTERPVLIHPLSGEQIDLGKLGDDPARAWREVSFDHFDKLIVRAPDGTPDLRLTYLAFWRFGPESPAGEIGSLWQMMPADTRVPDHSIWQHLDAVSALAGAVHDDEPALLTMSIGPVQSFIAQARSTSDLWAGSHLLSCLAWEVMRPIVEALGPDAILFPSLRGVPLVDLWLLEQHADWRARFVELCSKESDESPLFSAALPNKFSAIVPRSRAAELAKAATAAVRTHARMWAIDAAARVFKAADRSGEHWRQQVDEQLAGFPEVHWALAEWPAALEGEAALRAALGAFYPEERAPRPGFFDTPVWQVLSSPKTLDGVKFFEPNAGVLYPAVHDLADRSLAATKAARPFDALVQRGFRCTVTGEHEWLTDALDYAEANERAPTLLDLPANARATIHHGEATGTAWHALSEKKPSWARRGEHLGALATLKRIWPTIFCERIKERVGLDVRRFVVSTHALALATSLARLADSGDGDMQGRLLRLAGHVSNEEDDAVLPSSLAAKLRHAPELLKIARKLPVAMDRLREDRNALALLEGELARLLGHRHETYYGVIQMDGDRMGAWLAGNEDDTQLRFRETWHPQVQAAVKQFEIQPALKEYFDSFRPASPARHAFVSSALNQFSLHVAPHIVQVIGKGRLLYSGGDDVLALVAVDDLLPVMLLLRAAYSGWGDVSDLRRDLDLRRLRIGRGFVQFNERVLPAMGAKATASLGAVVAHHTAPLAHVLRQAREAEHRAKAAGRNSFCLRVMKRGGGEVGITASFRDRVASEHGTPQLKRTAAGYMLRLADALDATEFSRRAIYAACEWLHGLPPRPEGDDSQWRAMASTLLAKQFERQKGVAALADEAVDVACSESTPDKTPRFLADLLVSAEFFARQGRTG